ncbi:hypothetical protein F4809DRAFT_661260 [Biscogniauxia mediterranea]|nr:hypothetical protein F4809DRAFT_661260 [Biscogniauxia mediterranea]
MEAIKRWLEPKHKKSKGKSSSRPQVSSPVSGTFQQLTADDDDDDMNMIVYAPRSRRTKHTSALVATTTTTTTTTSFVPRDRGRKATLEWLYSGAPDSSVAKLGRERERAARQVRRGPKNLGTFEVQDLLRRPSRRAVERLHLARRQAEVAVRYGVSGAAAYNFSRSLRWNRIEGSRPVPSPPPQPHGFAGGGGGGGGGAGRPPSVTIAPAGPYTPIQWLELPESEAAGENRKSVTPTGESGGWRDAPLRGIGRHEFRAGFERGGEIEKEDVGSPGLLRIDGHVERELDLYDGSPQCLDPDDIVAGDQDEWETINEAQVMAIEEIPVRQVREVYVKPLRNRHSVEPMQPIEEVSSPEERGSAG